MRSLPDIVFRQADLRPDKEAVRDPARAVTYAELHDEVCSVASGLHRSGILPESRVLIALPNGIDFVTAHFGAMAARAISVPCEPNISLDRFRQVARSAQPQALIATPDTLRRLEPVLAEAPLQLVIAAGPGAELAGELSLPDLRALGDARRPELPDSDDLASIMYTTGSTGAPKGVCLRHSGVLAAIRNIQNFVGYTESDREVVVLPISHSFGLGHVYCNLSAGGSVYLDTGLLRVDRVLRAIETLEATGFPGTPLGYSLLLDKYGSVLPEKLRSLRFAVIDSAPLPPARTAQLQALLPWLNIMVYYGLTEASRSTFISLTAAGSSYWSSVGRASSNVRIRIVSERGSELPTGQEGEVCICGDHLSSGYWNEPEETSRRFQAGWLHTGDTGYLDKDGYLFLTGRLGDAINVGGLKVIPAEVEEVLMSFPGVRDSAVLGLLNPAMGSEEVIGVVVSAVEGPFRREECERYCLARLEAWKAPSRIVQLDRIPRSDTGKILRQELRDLVTGAVQQAVTVSQEENA